jgi:hypothetical protein
MRSKRGENADAADPHADGEIEKRRLGRDHGPQDTVVAMGELGSPPIRKRSALPLLSTLEEMSSRRLEYF